MFLRSIPQGDAQGIAYIGVGAYRPMSAESDLSTITPQKGVKRIIMSNDTSTTTDPTATTETDTSDATPETAEVTETVSLTVKAPSDLKSVEEYQALSKGQKATYRANVAKAGTQAIRDKDLDSAVLYQTHADEIAAAKSDTSGVTVNPVEVVLKRAAMLRAAAKRLESGVSVPDGLLADETDMLDFQDKLTEAVESGKLDEIKSSWTDADAKAIQAIATLKVTRSPKLGNVCDHVNSVIAAKQWESGSFHKVSETCVKSDIYPNGDSALNGRISQMLSKMNTGDRVEEDANFKASVRIQGETSTVGFIVL